MCESIWTDEGKDENYSHYRSHENFIDLRKWVDDAFCEKKIYSVLDDNFIDQFQNHDFFARLWELELAEWLFLTGLELVPTKGHGPDFCILIDGIKIWIEAVLATADEALDKLWRSRFNKAGKTKVYDFPKDANALRYASSLYTKGVKIKDSYIDKELINEEDYILIAVSGFPPGALQSGIEHFMRAALPMGDPVVHFSRNGEPLDPTVTRATHTDKLEYIKDNGSPVLKQFLYPGTYFPFIDGVLFTEASNLQNLLGSWSSNFNESTNIPHIFPNHASTKTLPIKLTDNFYLHEFVPNDTFMSLKITEPKKKLM